MKDVLFKIVNKAGHMVLNRPGKINSLTHEMIVEINGKLIEWEKDDNIRIVIFYGMGEKGFCAGGDMRVYYDNRERALEIAKEFFPSEYELDLKIINYPKPIVAILDGIVMGGGVGISYGADYKVVTETTKWSMPEVNIGFFPDVGASFFLNKIPEETARYISFLGKFLTGNDVLYLGYADVKTFKRDIPNIIDELSNIEHLDSDKEIQEVLEKYSINPGSSALANEKENIKNYFSGASLQEIISKLNSGTEAGDLWAEDTLHQLKKKSLLSQMIILEQLKKSKEFSVEECFELETTLSFNFMSNPDFFEGLRSVLVDKNEPNWFYKEPEEISKELIASFFIK